MKKHATILSLLLVPLMVFSMAWATEKPGNWKRGRIYYRMVCTACHVNDGGESLSPADKTIAEWKDYLDADYHTANQNADPSVQYYMGRDYRESIKDTNKAAAKFLDLPEEDLSQDLRAFVVHGAKDSDTPSRCK